MSVVIEPKNLSNTDGGVAHLAERVISILTFIKII